MPSRDPRARDTHASVNVTCPKGADLETDAYKKYVEKNKPLVHCVWALKKATNLVIHIVVKYKSSQRIKSLKLT